MIKLRLLLEQNATSYNSIEQFKRDWKAMGNTIKVYDETPDWYKQRLAKQGLSLEDNPYPLGKDELNNNLDSDHVNGSLLGIMIELFTEYGKPGVEISGGNDVAHNGMTGGINIHEAGDAIDLVPPNKGVDRDLDSILEKYKSKYAGFHYINEFTHPSPYSSGGHYHLQYDGSKLMSKVDKQKIDKALEPKQHDTFPQIPADATRVDKLVKAMPDLSRIKR